MDNKKLEDELIKLEEELAPTAEMQLGDTDVQQLVKDADLGGRSTVGVAGTVMMVVGLVWVVIPALVRLAAAVCASLRRLQRHRSPIDPSGDRDCFSPSLRSRPCAVSARSRAVCRTGSWPLPEPLDGAVPDHLLRRTGAAARQSDAARRRRRYRRRAAAAGGDAPCRRPADGGARDALPGVRHGRVRTCPTSSRTRARRCRASSRTCGW